MPGFDSLLNHGEYFTTHYFAEQLDDELRKGLLKAWSDREGDEHAGEQRETPRRRLPRLHAEYYAEKARTFFAERANLETLAAQDLEPGQHETAYTYGDPEWRSRIIAWHRKVLAALGFDAPVPQPSRDGGDAQDGLVELTVHHAGRDHAMRAAYQGPGVVALDCGWASGFDGLLASDGPARVLEPLRVTSAERYDDGAGLASLLMHAEAVNGVEPPRFVLLLLGGVIVLADRRSFGEGRYLAANLDAALPRGRQDAAKTGELATLAALFCREMLEPAENGEGPPLDRLLESNTRNAVGVADELRDGLRESVETIANEVLARLEGAQVDPRRLGEPRDFARQLTRESLRYLYRILFLLYAEARPELGILPADDDAYEAGYSIARLRELVAREEKLADERSRHGFHLYESLDLLFTKVNEGHRPYGSEAGDEKVEKRSEDLGLRFEKLNSDLFARGAIELIGRGLLHPDADDDDPDAPRLDTRLRNEALHKVLRRLTLTTGRKGPRGKRERGGFISYRNLGINQLGAVYEGLMSYTGFIADEELFEVAKKGDPSGGSWMVPKSRIDQYPDEVFVTYGPSDPDRRTGRKRHRKGEFVYRLSGRDRQTSASYYTPEMLTQLTVELALRELADDQTTAAQILQYKICEPALGSGAFLNEAINQVAALYLNRRQQELGRTIPTSTYLEELQKAKAYVALHNSYGVDLNATAVELAEVSLWLNTMHPGMHAPWYGLHLRRGNSLIGGRRAVYAADDVTVGQWAKSSKPLAPTELPFLADGAPQSLPDGAVHQFLLPAAGWAAVARETDAKALEPVLAKQLAAWRSGIVKAPRAKVTQGKKSQLERLQGLARRAEFLWRLVVERIELSEDQIARKIDVWGAKHESGEDPDLFAFLKQPEHPVPKEQVYADLFEATGTPYWRLKLLMDTWCALWFWPLDKAGLLDGTFAEYESAPSAPALPDFVLEERRKAWESGVVEQGILFDFEQRRLLEADDSGEFATVEVKVGSAPRKLGPRKPKPQRRAKIPLKDLNDWIEFAECLLGADDVPADSLMSEFPSLTALSEYEDALPGATGMDSEFALSNRFPWLDAIQDIATEQGFFHWELAFAHTFAAHGGFDLQVGNPPWVRPEWKEDLVLAEFEPWFALAEKASQEEKERRRAAHLGAAHSRAYWLAERLKTTAYSDYFSSPTTYELLAGQPDFYRCFMVHTWASCSARGAIGLLHPDTHFSGEREAALRAEAYSRLRVHGDFVNAGNRFFPPPIGRSSHFGLHVYGPRREIGFDNYSWLYSINALRGSTMLTSSAEDVPGIKRDGDWNRDPHPARRVRVDRDVLELWQRLSGETDEPVEHARLLTPVSTAEESAIRSLADYPIRFGRFDPQITPGFHESGAKKAGLIQYGLSAPNEWSEVVLKGLQIGVATPFFKEPDAGSNDLPMILAELPADAVPRTEYRPAGSRARFEAEKDRWIDHTLLAELRADEGEIEAAREALSEAAALAGRGVTEKDVDDYLVAKSRRPYTDFHRMAWRERAADDTERALYVSVIPRMVTHVHGVRSGILHTVRHSLLSASFWGSLPVDYFLRITGIEHVDVGPAKRLPAPVSEHPLVEALLLRGMRLNCLTSAYGDLWHELYEPSWADEQWAIDWPELHPLGGVQLDWTPATGLRTERSRRSALVEIDALVAVWLGIDADTLVTMYRARFPILQDFERVMWFDADERKIAGDRYTYGWGQTKEHWAQFEKYQQNPVNCPVPDGYAAPFYKADREAEMRAAHAVFQARLDGAVQRGEWDPVRQEVPGS